MFGRTIAITATLTMAATGCLSGAHRIPRGELVRLSQSPPESRGQRVRVIQGFSGDDEPPEAPGVHVHTHVVIVGSTGGGGGGHRSRTSAASKAEDSRFWLIVAGIAAVGLAATEGARFDGWAQLHPMHPVHLYGPYGEYTWVPLAQLDPQTAAWATKAYVRDTEGPWQPLERAPLNRVGFTYALTLGAAEIPSAREQAIEGDDAAETGFLGHIQLGVFPTQMVGVLLDFGLGWRENSFGSTVFEGRNSLELEFFPLAAGKLHAGGYGQLGLALRSEDGVVSTQRRSFVGGAGGLVQLEITTRLALMGRFGYVRILGEDTAEASLGVAIY